MPSNLSRETRSQHQHAQNGVNIILTSIISNVPDAQQDFATRSISGDGHKLQKVDSSKENFVVNACRRTKDTTDGLDCTLQSMGISVLSS